MKFFRSSNSIKREVGTASLYAVFILPLAVLLAAVTTDISGWNALRDKLQQEADRVAFEALSGLPNLQAVEAYVQSSTSALNIQNVQSRVFYPARGNSSVGVTLSSKYRSHFDFLVRGWLKNAFKVERSSVAQLVPGDFVIIVSDGASLRPQPVPLPGAAGSFELPSWGSPLDWPASSYFSCVAPPILTSPNELGWSWWNDWKKNSFRRWATQSCFNPSFTPLKLAAIELGENILRSGTNRLSVLLTPGDFSGRGFRALRHIHDEADQPSLYATQRGGFPTGGQTHAEWNDYTELERFLGNEVCMMISQPETDLMAQFELPKESESASCSRPMEFPPCGGFHFASGHLTECYADGGLSLREAIYWDAAKLRVPGFESEPNVMAALRQSWNELTDERTIALEQSVRGNFANSALRKVYLFSDFLPRVSGDITTLLNAYRARGIDVIIFPFFHEGLSSGEAARLESSASEWNELSRINSSVQVVPLHSAEDLQSVALPRAVSDATQFALRS